MEREGYAYSYCEFPERHQLFVSVPRCETGTVDGCDSAYIAEYDTRDFSKRKVHRFFDDNFMGGLRELLCVGDALHELEKHGPQALLYVQHAIHAALVALGFPL